MMDDMKKHQMTAWQWLMETVGDYIDTKERDDKAEVNSI